jgi:hypothetical protein
MLKFREKEADEVYGSEDRQTLLIWKVKVKDLIIKTKIIVFVYTMSWTVVEKKQASLTTNRYILQDDNSNNNLHAITQITLITVENHCSYFIWGLHSM